MEKNPDLRRQLSENARLLWREAEYREKVCANMVKARENPEFARKSKENGIVLISPGEEVMRKMGQKEIAREIAVSAGVPVTPGSDILDGSDNALKEANRIGYQIEGQRRRNGAPFGRQIGYKIDLSDEAKEFVATKGYDVQFGARPLKRAIQTYIEDGISEMIVNDELATGSTIIIDKHPEKEELTFNLKS